MPLDPHCPAEEHLLRLRRFAFDGGVILGDFDIAYWTCGALNARRDNALLIHHNASGTREAMKAFCGKGLAFDPAQHFLIALDAPGGGGSARRSLRDDFPASYSVADCANAAAQLLDRLEIRARAFCGPSMASLIGLELAMQRPDLVQSLVFWVGGCRSDGFARAAAEALGAALLNDDTDAGWVAAARAFFGAIAGRGMLAAMSETDLERAATAMAREWQANWRADELASRYASILRCDVVASHGGAAAFAEKLRIPCLWLQAEDDSVFPVDQVRALTRLMPHAALKTIDTPYGHVATNAPRQSAEQVFFIDETRAFLERIQS